MFYQKKKKLLLLKKNWKKKIMVQKYKVGHFLIWLLSKSFTFALLFLELFAFATTTFGPIYFLKFIYICHKRGLISFIIYVNIISFNLTFIYFCTLIHFFGVLSNISKLTIRTNNSNNITPNRCHRIFKLYI